MLEILRCGRPNKLVLCEFICIFKIAQIHLIYLPSHVSNIGYVWFKQQQQQQTTTLYYTFKNTNVSMHSNSLHDLSAWHSQWGFIRAESPSLSCPNRSSTISADPLEHSFIFHLPPSLSLEHLWDTHCSSQHTNRCSSGFIFDARVTCLSKNSV